MAEKIREFSSKFGKGGMPGAPKGLGLGVKLLAAGAAAVYGVQQSMYTGKIRGITEDHGFMRKIYILTEMTI